MNDPSTGSGSCPSTSSGQGALERALAWLRRARSAERLRRERPAERLRRARRDVESEPLPTLTAAAFRAVIGERLRSLERQLDEVKGRVNGLIFLLADAVATQLILQLVR